VISSQELSDLLFLFAGVAVVEVAEILETFLVLLRTVFPMVADGGVFLLSRVAPDLRAEGANLGAGGGEELHEWGVTSSYLDAHPSLLTLSIFLIRETTSPTCQGPLSLSRKSTNCPSEGHSDR
jgi:hypothetical protein